MLVQLCGASRRLRTVGATIALIVVSAGSNGALAHGGHEHDTPPVVEVTAAHPRVAVQSDVYELVGILRGDRLGLTLDRFASNEPVTDAAIAVTVGSDPEVPATPRPDGTYSVTSPSFLGAGALELIFSVVAPGGDDLLIGTLQLPQQPVAAATEAIARGSVSGVVESASIVRIGGADIDASYVIAAVSLALGFVLGLAVRAGGSQDPMEVRGKGRRENRRQGLGVVKLASLGLVLLIATTALAVSEEATPAPSAAENPRRLSDGTLFVPKPSQRLLNIRTRVTKLEAAAKATRLIGRVIADPNRGGIVQSTSGGRVLATGNGLPRVGQAVRKGDVLAVVERTLPAEERVNLSERLAEIEQLMAVAESKLGRVRKLAGRGVTAQGELIDAETELDGLGRRAQIIRATRAETEELKAPADGVISTMRVTSGQVVQVEEVLFEIVDPNGLWVEALSFGSLDAAHITGASALVGDGTPLELEFEGFSRALQQQATVLQFAIETPPGNLSVGQPVTVVVQGTPLSAILLPRDAVVSGPNGEALVWNHVEPERFAAVPVLTEPFDASSIAIRSGLGEGARIVTIGAQLINQVR